MMMSTVCTSKNMQGKQGNIQLLTNHQTLLQGYTLAIPEAEVQELYNIGVE